MREFKTTSLADQIFERLENDVIMGVYSKGEILTELKLVEQLGVSRTPIREALRRLEQERLIEDTGKGSVVLGITEEDLVDIMNIRTHVEGLAAFFAAQNGTDEEIRDLKHIMELQEFYGARKDIEYLREMDDQFHDAICNMSKRNVIRDTLVPLHRKTRRFRKISIQEQGRTERMLEEHWEIFRAIEKRDCAEASRLISRHVELAKENMIERMNNHG